MGSRADPVTRPSCQSRSGPHGLPLHWPNGGRRVPVGASRGSPVGWAGGVGHDMLGGTTAEVPALVAVPSRAPIRTPGYSGPYATGSGPANLSLDLRARCRLDYVPSGWLRPPTLPLTSPIRSGSSPFGPRAIRRSPHGLRDPVSSFRASTSDRPPKNVIPTPVVSAHVRVTHVRLTFTGDHP